MNGNFSLSSLRSENHFLHSDCNDAKWNRYIFYDILPDLHVKLLEYVMTFEEYRENSDKINFIPHDFWPIEKNFTMGLYKYYELFVITKLGLDDHKIFWTKAKGGQFISLQTAKFVKEEETIITDILVNLGIPAVKVDENRLKQLEEASKQNPNFKYTCLNGSLVCKELRGLNIHIDHDLLFKLLDFILKDLKDKSSYEILTGLPLVPLNNGSVGKFGNVYYVEVAEEQKYQKYLDLFPNIGPSKFVSIKIPTDLLIIFTDEKFSEKTKIKKFDSSAILDLLIDELPEDVLVRPDITNPLLYLPENGHILCSVLVKLQVRFTKFIIPETANENLKKCIVKCTPITIVNSLERTCSLLSLTMNQLFEKANLLPSDYEKFRTFLKQEFKVLTEK